MDIKKIISELTLEEKASLCSGEDFWHTKAIERLGIPSIMVSDGPHGLRKQDPNTDAVNTSIEAVCFPSACALACSFDRDLIYSMGQALGNECQAEDVSIILGPGANIKRSPLCGRNFEYFSEDPYLASQMATNHIKGVQSKGVGTSLKHFLANNQETRRMSVDEEIDERTLHEIYLSAFETAVKEAKPKTVMCSYNKVNGVYSSENKYTLTDILRDKWGFEGFVVSDWGAVCNRPKGVSAGLDLEMPASGGINDKEIVKAVKNGTLAESDVDRACERILKVVDECLSNHDENAIWDKTADHLLAEKIAEQCIILLKNDDKILPLNKDKKIAVIGKFAEEPRFQGGGSSHINTLAVDSFFDYAKTVLENITYAQGYVTDEDKIDEKLISEAVELARNSDVAVIFAGLTDLFESEGFDRSHMRMPECQNMLISRVTEVQPNTVVILQNGSPIEMSWIDSVKGIIEAYLGGEAVNTAICKILFGEVNPSGKLAETFPKKLSDNPSYLNFPGEGDSVKYREGIFVGYRYYDYKKMDVLFPFGHGLSYTEFEYSNIRLSSDRINAENTLEVTVNVKNIGDIAGREIVQLYVGDCESSVIRPVKELKGFEKIYLGAGESTDVTFKLDRRAFAFYSEKVHDWFVESGEFCVFVGKSSRDIQLTAKVYVESSDRMPFVCTPDTTMGDIMADDRIKHYIDPLVAIYAKSLNTENAELGQATQLMLESQLKDNPLHVMVSFSDGQVTHEMIADICEKINAELNK